MSAQTEVEWILPEALQQLSACDREIVDEILSVFQSDTASRLQSLLGAVRSDHRSDVRAQAHSLKGSALQVGAIALAAAFREMEIAAESARDLSVLMNEIDARFASVCRAIRGAGYQPAQAN